MSALYERQIASPKSVDNPVQVFAGRRQSSYGEAVCTTLHTF